MIDPLTAAKPETLSPAEYRAMQDRIQLIGRLVLDTDADSLATFIQQGEHADTVGPFIDPTAWNAGHEQLARVLRHARALASFHKALRS